VSGLRQIPTAVRDTDEGSGSDIQIAMSDLDAATELAGIKRPPAGTTDVDALTDWLLTLNGPGREDKTPVLAALLPQAAQPESFGHVAEFIDEVGWSISDVHTFVEYQTPPNVFTVLTGTFDADALTKAMGEPTDGMWSLGGDDFSVDPASRSTARPLGESLRLSLRDDTLAVARSTPPIEAWLASDDSSKGTLADDEGLVAVGDALDKTKVYSAMLVESDFSGPRPNAPPTSGPVPSGLGPFVDVGVGQAIEDGTPLAVFAYYYDDEAAAAAAVDPLTDLLEEGFSFRTNKLWSDSFGIRDISADGHVLTATLELKDFSPGSVWNILFARDNLFTGSS